MSNGMAQVSILERLGLSGVEATPFTLKWVEKAFSEENIDILKSILDPNCILRLNKLTDEQKQILIALPVNDIHEVDESFRNGILSLNPMHIAMTMIGYKLVCNECGTYIENEDALILTTDDEEELCPHCEKSNGLMDLIFGENNAVC